MHVKFNLVQEACSKCFGVHELKFEIWQTTWKNKTKNVKVLDLLMKNSKLKVWCSLFHFFHVICKISNFYMWTAKHLPQASWTELTLHINNLLSITYQYFWHASKIFSLKWCNRGNFLIAPTLAIDSGTPDQYYHHGVQGLLSHVGSQGNVRVCRYSKLLLQLYRAKT